MTGTTISSHHPTKRPRETESNAFTKLMSGDRKHEQVKTKQQKPNVTVFPGRDGLGAYTYDPSAFGADLVIYYNDDFTIIKDLYPKSSIHTLVLPRSDKKLLHPFDAFEDTEFLSLVRQETEKVKTMVASELRRKYGHLSRTDAARVEAMESDNPPEELPTGRDWSKDVITGIHAHPSMNHLHVHVLSRDMVSDCLKHRRHYESFNTPFLVGLEHFPLPLDDPRRDPRRSRYLDQDLKCWRCGKNFGNKFKKLKEHLAEEFEEWKRQ